jgi:hypothetical protein
MVGADISVSVRECCGLCRLFVLGSDPPGRKRTNTRQK